MGYAQVDGVPKVFQLVGDSQRGYQLRRYTGDAKKVVIPAGAGIVMIQPNAFQYKNAETVIIPEGVKSIETEAFFRCRSLKEIVLPGSLKYIRSNAFKECESLSSITLPEGLVDIDNYAFECFRDLKIDYIPASVKNIGRHAFSSQTTKEIAPGMQGIGDALIQYTGEEAEVHIPEGIRIIAADAFEGNETLKTVYIGKNVEYVGTDVFSDCRELKSVYFEDGVKSIGERCFEHCYNLEDVRLPETITELKSELFLGCRGLKQLRIPNGVTAIRDEVFSYCYSLMHINLPEQLQTISKLNPKFILRSPVPAVLEFPLQAQKALGTKAIREIIISDVLLRKYLVEETDYSSFEQEITKYLRLKQARTRLLKGAIKKDDIELIQKLIEAYPMTPDELQKMKQLAKDLGKTKALDYFSSALTQLK